LRVRAGQLSLYREKHLHEDYDVIVASDNTAFRFLLANGPELFPGVPLVFCGVNDFKPESIKGLDATGVVENLKVAETLELAIKLHPDRKRLVVIGDDSETDDAIRQQILDALPQFEDRLEVELLFYSTLEETRARMRELEADSIFYMVPFFAEVRGRFSHPGYITKALSEGFEAPFYSNWDFMLGHGIVGGSLLSGVEHGREVAGTVLRILDGERASDIPVLSEPRGGPAFDYQKLQLFGISKSMIPEGSRIIGEPKAFYELDKEILWTIVTAIVLLVLGLVFLMFNIAGRREVERRLRDQLSFQEILMDTIPQLVCWKDRQQQYLGANRAFTRFFGIKGPITEAKPMDEDDMPDMSFVRLAESWDREVMESESPIYRTRTRTVNAEGGQATLEVNKVPLRDRSGRVFGTLTTADDVTREANLERQLLQSQKMEAIGTLAGGIAHDFNNILTSIINSTEMASWDVDPESTAGKDLSRVLKAANRGSSLVKQILNFSRPSKEGIQPTDLAEVVSDSLGLLKSSLPGNIEVAENIEPGLPKCPADPTQINQIVMNLCTNAFHAVQDRGGRIEVGLSKVLVDGSRAADLNLDPGPYAALTVTDDGPGISPVIVDKIFDPFFTTKGKSQGTGLGLAVVLGIIKAHYGSVSVESRPGEMTRFTVYLPIRPLRERSEDRPRRAPGQGAGRLLFVEDEQDQLETVPRILERLGYKVTVCSDAMCAVGAVLSNPKAFDLVVTDFDMPVTDGLELARILLGNAPDLPLIMVTGLERAITLEGVPNIKKTVLKPYNGQELSEAIMEVLGQKAAADSKETA